MWNKNINIICLWIKNYLKSENNVVLQFEFCGMIAQKNLIFMIKIVLKKKHNFLVQNFCILH